MNREFIVTPIDRYFADFMVSCTGGTSMFILDVALLISNVSGAGHICLNLAELCGSDILLGGKQVSLPSYDVLSVDLELSGVVGVPGDFRPLILDSSGRLYLYRYWHYEQHLATAILERTLLPADDLDELQVADGINRLFTSPGSVQPDWQQVSVLAALRKRFCIISGGPGTGKTSTVVKILALMLEQPGNQKLRIALAAPTGKSAARLKESISRMKESLGCEQQIRDAIPADVSTVHRLLGSLPGSHRFRHNETNRLPHDLIVIDEASMIALPLMAKLVTALKPEARLILLGDRDQLASVEAGAVLGDLCGKHDSEPYSAGFSVTCKTVLGMSLPDAQEGMPVQPLSDCLVVLKKNYRFSDAGGIGALARCINTGDGMAALRLLNDDLSTDTAWHDLPAPEQLRNAFDDIVTDAYRPYLTAGSVQSALILFDQFRFLCALRQGMFGVEGINRMTEEILSRNGLIETDDRWYKGRPVMITVNDYRLKLFNGDIGLLWPDDADGGTLKAFFAGNSGVLRAISPLRLPEHETVYAMTVHKSQGSEFRTVTMILTDRDAPVVTRELIYTGVTRAKESVSVWGEKDLFVSGVERTVQRTSGLMDLLWNRP